MTFQISEASRWRRSQLPDFLDLSQSSRKSDPTGLVKGKVGAASRWRRTPLPEFLDLSQSSGKYPTGFVKGKVSASQKHSDEKNSRVPQVSP